MEKIGFNELSDLLFAKIIVVEIDGFITFPQMSSEPDTPFMSLVIDQTGEQLDFHEDNNKKVEIVSRRPLVINLLDTRGALHEIIPFTFMEL